MAIPGGAIGAFEKTYTFESTIIGTGAAAGVELLNSSDTGNTAFVETAAANGPVARAATDTTDNDMCELAHGLVTWSAQHGELIMEASVEFDDVTNLAFTVGFNDDALDDGNTLPVELSTTTFTSTATTFIGFVYDVDATNDDLHAFWVDDDGDAAEAIADLRFANVNPTNAERMYFRVALQDRGSGRQAHATFSVSDHQGFYAEKIFRSTVDRDALLTPHIAFENRSGSVHTCDVGYLYLKMSLPV